MAEFLGTGGAPIGIDVEGHGRHEELAADVDLSRTVGWFTTKYPVSLTVGGLSWAQVMAGEAALGAVIKDAKEQLRALPDPLTYGLLRYLNPEVELAGSDPPIGFNYLGRLGAAAAELSGDVWRISQEGLSLTGAAAAVPMPLAHTVELNAGTVDTDAGPQLHANWTWAPSALDHAQVSRLSRLWFDALAGICAHVRGGGGGLTPSDIAPARLSQQQIDELHRQYADRRRVAADPAAAGAALSRQHRAGQRRRCVCGAAGYHRDRRARPAPAARCGAHGGQPASATWRPDSATQFDEPVQIIPADPVAPWRYVELDADDVDVDEQIQRVCAAERAAVCDLADQPAFRVALIRTAADRHRFVLTNHHIVLDGWSLPILLREIFASYYGQRLPAAASVSQVCHLAGRSGPRCRPRGLARGAGRFRHPHPGGPAGPVGAGAARRCIVSGARARPRGPLSELARSRHTTVNTVLQGAFAQLLMWLTGQHDVAFGTAVSGRPAEVAGAESMVGLLINTVPVRATHHAGNHHRRPARSAAKRPQRHPRAPAPGA